MTTESKTADCKLSRIARKFSCIQPFSELVTRLKEDPGRLTTVTGLAGSSTAILAAGLTQELRHTLLVVTSGSDGAEGLYDDLVAVIGQVKVGLFPSRQILPYDFRAPVGEIMGHRISTLAGLADQRLSVVVAPVRALVEPTMAVESLDNGRIDLQRGQEADLDKLIERLLKLGFRRVPVVEEVGDFSLRGGLVDFFTPGSEAPVRVEFFDDEVDTLRLFDVATQRTLDRIDRVSVLPRREVPVTHESLDRFLDRLPEDDADLIRARYINDPELPGLEWLSVSFGIKQGALSDYLPESTIVMLEGEGNLKAEVEAILEEGRSLHDKAKRQLSSVPPPEKYYQSAEKLFDDLHQHSLVDIVPFRGAREGIVSFGCSEPPSFGARLDLLAEKISEFVATGCEYFIATDTEGQGRRLQQLIADKTEGRVEPVIEAANLKGGFVCPEGGLAVLTDHEIFSRYHRRVRRKKFKEGVAISDYASLNQGDYVVHTDHGVARYLGLKTLEVEGLKRDCLHLEYDEKDRLYVPIEEFNRVSKYCGKDSSPTLTRLGGPGWDKLKKKTRKAIDDIAADLVTLYAKRKALPGFSFGEDTVWLKQLEASFPFDETADQQKAIDDVKRDMALQAPMDRLVCGDVGYGKTEVAVRAAFKAVEQGKQVAILVPTTVLAQQHLQTFSERLAEFPVRIEMLSRFRTPAQRSETIEALAVGQVDLVIGTHRLLSKDVHFKQLGLLIVDEEHRFGVRHKEKLRQLAANVDTISMTATPIPRTMQMSLIGVRDMSLITTSPKDRLPIATEIVEFDPALIATAILREVDRGGQVFFVHNRVQTIDAMYRYLKKIVPQVEIAIGHGQMHERSLEGIMLAFVNRQFNVLLCTSIIESGLDIPSANTIIINRADRFGLAQLYQIRGRVGRSDRQAYAYLVAPSPKLLTAAGLKRLRALEAHSDLGAGFALAMRDLEIRGAGTVLGAKQSGFIEDVGYDIYNKMLEEAVAEQRGMPILRLPECKIETNIEMHLPDAYINDRQQKVDTYRRIADSRTLDDVENIRDEVIDRFGSLPPSAANLFDGAGCKIAAAMLEIEKVILRGGNASLVFKKDRQLQRSEVEALRKATDRPMEFSLAGQAQIKLDLGQVSEDQRLSYLRGVLGKV